MSLNRYLIACSMALALGFSIPASAAENTQGATTTSASSATSSSGEKANSEKVNINTADAEQLKTLKGVGDAKAQAIVNYRTQHGAFKSVDELASVKGMSQKTLATLVKNNPGRIVME